MTAQPAGTTFAAWLEAAMHAKYGTGTGAAARLAQDSGVSQQSISRYRRGIGGTPTPDVIKRLAVALDTAPDEALAAAGLTAGENRPPVTPTAAMVRMLHDEARGIDDPEQLAEIEKNLRHQIRITEDYMRLSIELLRRKATGQAPDSTDDATA